MNRTTPNTRPRFSVANKPSRKNPGPAWAVVDRLERKVTQRFVFKASADQVARELNDRHDPIPASARNPRDSWPSWTDSGRWACTTPEIAPAEVEDLDEVDARDRADWAAMSNQADGDELWFTDLAGLREFLERTDPAALYEEQALAEFGVIIRRPA